MIEHKLRVLNITKQAEDPLTLGIALGTAMKIDGAVNKALSDGDKVAFVNLTDLQFLLDYVKPYIEGVRQAISDAQKEKDDEAAADAQLKAELEKVKTFRKAYERHIQEHKELIGGSPFGGRVK